MDFKKTTFLTPFSNGFLSWNPTKPKRGNFSLKTLHFLENLDFYRKLFALFPDDNSTREKLVESN